MNTSVNSNGSNPGYVVATEAEDTAGAISYWRLSGPVSVQILTDAWTAEGLDPQLLPAPPEPEAALRRAVTGQQARRRLVRPLERRGAWVIKDEQVVKRPDGHGGTTEDTDYVTVARVYFDASRRGYSYGYSYPINIEKADASDKVFSEIETAIISDYHTHRAELAPEDISAWLITLAKAQNAASLRDAGGIYFIPRPAMDFWRSAVRAVEAASNNKHKIFKIPALKNAEAVEAILDAVTQEAQAEAEAIEADLVAECEEGAEGAEEKAALSARAVRTRTKRCAAILSKVSAYEGLLGVKLDVIRDRVETLKADLAAAALLSSPSSTAS